MINSYNCSNKGKEDSSEEMVPACISNTLNASTRLLNIGPIRIYILMDTRNVEQTGDVCMYIEEFILVDIWIHCCTKLN